MIENFIWIYLNTFSNIPIIITAKKIEINKFLKLRFGSMLLPGFNEIDDKTQISDQQ